MFFHKYVPWKIDSYYGNLHTAKPQLKKDKENFRIHSNMSDFEFPEDVWGVVMSFFHSSYKRPSHYDAIMSIDDFRNKAEFVRNDQRIKAPMFVSYYAHIIATNWDYWRMPPDLGLFRNEVTLTRGVARGKTLDDFVEIWRQYKKNQYYYGGAEIDYTYIV